MNILVACEESQRVCIAFREKGHRTFSCDVIECKRVERLNLYDAMAQAKSDAKQDKIPVVMHRKDKCDWLVTLSLEDFIEIYKKSDYCEGGDAV